MERERERGRKREGEEQFRQHDTQFYDTMLCTFTLIIIFT